MKIIDRLKNLPLLTHSFFYFALFLTTNTLLSYFNFPFQTQLWVALFGLLIPFALALNGASGFHLQTSQHPEEFLPSISHWVWMGLGILAIWVRLYRLTTLTIWPNYDEGIESYYALRILEKGFDRFFYLSSNVPPFYFWVESLFFKWGRVSLESIWFCPIFFSFFLMPLAYWASRQYFSKSFSFLCALLSAFSFEPWYIGRLSSQIALLPILEVVILGWMGKLLHSQTHSKRWIALGLGGGVGLAFYAVNDHWIAVALAVALTVCWKYYPKEHDILFCFSISFFLTFFPFAYETLHVNSAYLRSLGPSGISQSWSDHLKVALFYPQSIFWGASLSFSTYQPVWGGFLNPILGSFFFLGAIEIVKNRGVPIYRWLGIAFLFFLIPGILSQDAESLRISPIWAVLIPVSSLGMSRLLIFFSVQRKVFVLMFWMLFSFALDFHHLEVYHHLWDSPSYWLQVKKSIINYRAYGILKAKAFSDGSGLILSNFPASNCDQTLNVATHDFNAALNPLLQPKKAKWAALLVNVNYQPFLAKQLGVGKSYWLSKDLNLPDGGWMLWVITITSSNQPEILRLTKANQSLDGFIDSYLQNLSYRSGHTYEKVLNALQQAYSYFQNNPFLLASFWEKVADMEIKMNNSPLAVAALGHAVLSGCPAAHLFYRLGVLQLSSQNLPEAKKNFQNAAKAPLDFTQSHLLLEQMSSKKNNL